MLKQILRYQYALSALWTKIDRAEILYKLRMVQGSITCSSSENLYDISHKVFEDEYLKSDDGLKMIRDGWQFKLSVSFIIDQSTNVFTIND